MEVGSVSADRTGALSSSVVPERTATYASRSDQQSEEADRAAARDDARSGERPAAAGEDEPGSHVDVRA